MSEKKHHPFVTIQLPEDMIKLVDEIVDEKTFGFRSRTEFVKEAVRRMYTDYSKLKEALFKNK